MFQPNPKIPLPDPELYDTDNEGEAPLAGEAGKGIEKDDVPLTALTENFTSRPLMAPPPFGSAIDGISIAFDLVLAVSASGEITELVFPESLLEDKLFCWLFMLFNLGQMNYPIF